MPAPSTPTNFYAQTGNRQNFLSWDLDTTATSYTVQRSLDGLTYATVASPAVPNYLDTAVTVGTQYYYKVLATNGFGSSAYTDPQSVVPTPTAEMSLGQLRLACQQRADRVNSQFVTLPEWNSYIVQSCYELYDLLITSEQDLFIGQPALFLTNGSSYRYSLPDGVTAFQDQAGNAFVAPPFYKLTGVDLGINTANNAYVTVSKFNFIDRNRFVYPNTASTLYGVFNLQYRLVGPTTLELIPTPSANQKIQLWYIPRLRQLLQDTDLTDISISGWIEYVIVDAAIKALQKEESDVSVLMAQKAALIKRIEETATNRDVGSPDRISDVRQNGYWGPASGGWSGPIGGF